ncbi:MAG: Hsp20 family protein [Acidobacteriota bacterium]
MSTQLAPEVQTSAVPVKINTVGIETLFNRAKEIYESIARRAYELFNIRGRQDGFDLEDWLNAERELLRPVSLDLTESDNRLTVRAEVPGFSEKELKVNLEPRRLVITGKIEESSEEKTGETFTTSRRSNEIFHTLDLPVQVDPTKASAILKNGTLELRMPKSAKPETARVDVKVG